MSKNESKLTAEHRKRIAKTVRRELVKDVEVYFRAFNEDWVRPAKFPVADAADADDPSWVEACAIGAKEHEKFLDYIQRFDRTP